MALISCPECNKEVSNKAPACVGCGYPIGYNEQIIYDPFEIKAYVDFVLSVLNSIEDHFKEKYDRFEDVSCDIINMFKSFPEKIAGEIDIPEISAEISGDLMRLTENAIEILEDFPSTDSMVDDLKEYMDECLSKHTNSVANTFEQYFKTLLHKIEGLENILKTNSKSKAIVDLQEETTSLKSQIAVLMKLASK